jgi:hypothetical protein
VLAKLGCVEEDEKVIKHLTLSTDYSLKKEEDGEMFQMELAPMGIMTAPRKVFGVVQHELRFETEEMIGKIQPICWKRESA